MALTYDLNGNLTSDGLHTYSWDARNQLISIDSGGAATYAYDPLGRRITKNISGVASTSFLYDGWNPVQGISGGSPTANLVTGGVDEYFTRADSSGASYLLTDALGSTAALTDANGAVQTQYSYEPFGGTMQTGASTNNSFAYTGREQDAAGLYFYRARYYSPKLGRFISQDPIGFAGGTNIYQYAYDDPITFRDPFGRDPVIGATAGALLGGFYGAWGAWTTGGNGKDIAEAALLGGLAGGVVGALDPSFGVAVVLGGAVGAGTDALGQWITNRNHHTNCYNEPEIWGAGIGGALGGAAGWGLGGTAKAAGLADTWSFNGANQFLSGAPGYAGTAIGSTYGDQGDNSSQGLSGRKDSPNSSGCQ